MLQFSNDPWMGLALQQQQAMNNVNLFSYGVLLSNAIESPLSRAQRIAAEVRARRPEMQVRRLK